MEKLEDIERNMEWLSKVAFNHKGCLRNRPRTRCLRQYNSNLQIIYEGADIKESIQYDVQMNCALRMNGIKIKSKEFSMKNQARKAHPRCRTLGHATKALAKEMLPMLTSQPSTLSLKKPLKSGIEDILVVTGKVKNVLSKTTFNSNFELEYNLEQKVRQRVEIG